MANTEVKKFFNRRLTTGVDAFVFPVLSETLAENSYFSSEKQNSAKKVTLSAFNFKAL